LGLGIDDFTDLLAQEPRRIALMQQISVVADPLCDAVFPDQAPAVLTVLTVAGERLVEQVMVNRGGPDRPLDDWELAAKFTDCANARFCCLSSNRCRQRSRACPPSVPRRSLSSLTAEQQKNRRIWEVSDEQF
jgi:2-methylcitrate dehydratase PrpD